MCRSDKAGLMSSRRTQTRRDVRGGPGGYPRISQEADHPTLDIREQIARIDRLVVENARLQTETRRLNVGGGKLTANRWVAPFIATGTFVAAVGGFVTNILSLLRTTGHG